MPHEDFERCYMDLGTTDKAEYTPLADAQGNPLSFDDIPSHLEVFENFIKQMAKTLSATVEPIEL